MTRQETLANYLKSHPETTIEQIAFLKQALKYYETKYGELEDDYELEVRCAIEIYIEQ